MIRQALTALGPRTVLPVVLVGGAALALGALFLPRGEPAPTMYRLVLHAPEEQGYAYVSAWNDGDVLIPAGELRPLTFTRRADEHDGCTWLGTERLVPIGSRAYHYSYQETILSCSDDARPFVKTPRAGIVTIEPYTGAGAPTALNAIQPAGNLWNPPDDADSDDVADEVSDDDDDDAAEITLIQLQLAAQQADDDE
jgi:hypothetical protein